MIKYFYEGGPLFMGMLTVVLIAVIAVSVLTLLKKGSPGEAARGYGDSIRSLGLFALVLGMLGQFIGLFTAFEFISGGMEVSPEMMAGGVKVSMITSIYGMIIFVISYLLWFASRFFKRDR